jgi:hypothetical protein
MSTKIGRLALLATLCTLVFATQAFAADVVDPHPPVAIAADAKGKPVATKIVASGFQPNAQVYVEQCDGTAPTTPQWSPTANCDLGSSPAPATADNNGTVTFDGKKMFQAFVGESPQQLFNCMRPGEAEPKNGLPTFGDCQLRVSTNNSSATTDQVIVAIVLGAPDSAKNTSNGSLSTTTPSAANAGTNAGGSGTRNAKGATTTTTTTLPFVASAPTHHGSKASTSPTSSSAMTGYSLIILGLLLALAGRFGLRRRRA